MLKYKKKRLEDKIRKSKVETKCIIEMYGNDDDGVAKEGRGHYEQWRMLRNSLDSINDEMS